MKIRPIYFKNLLIDALGVAAEKYPLRPLVNAKTVNLQQLTNEESDMWQYGSEEEVMIQPSAAYDSLPKKLASAVGTYRSGPQFVVELGEVELLGETGLTKTAEGQYLLENSLRQKTWFLRQYISNLVSINTLRTQSTETEFDVAVSMVGPWSWGYYHWFAEYLPRFKGVERYMEATGVQPTVLVPRDPPKWMQRSIEFIGWDDYVEWPKGNLSVNRLIVPTVPYLYHTKTPSKQITSIAAYSWVAKRIKKNISSIDNENQKLYVSRDDAKERRVVNEDEIIPILSKHGFKRYVMSEHPFEKQVQLFANADVILAPHGAGLVNTIFGVDLTIIEMFGNYTNECYFTLAQGMGFDYYSVMAEPVNENMRIDPARLDRILRQTV